ncbi:MAG: sigma-70 family RNA polymerase sigma factor [Phycisphaerales bacterium]|nr:sigma-70 family RNA polymerase sigma factor [Phycisphaerales bacterium]
MGNTESTLSDPELVAACIEGSERAWAALVDRYGRLVYSIPARHHLPEHLRDDVFQSVWAIAVRHLAGLRDGQSLAAWLIRTTQRETWRVARASRGTHGSDSTDDLVWSDPAEADLLEERQHIREALDSLDDRCRQLLLVVFREDRPDYGIVAEQLGIPRGSIGPTRGRCLNKLRTILAERCTPTAE